MATGWRIFAGEAEAQWRENQERRTICGGGAKGEGAAGEGKVEEEEERWFVE